MFTQAFVNDCILIFNELKSKPKGPQGNAFDITVKSGEPLSSNQDEPIAPPQDQAQNDIGGK